jgi:hypothetical protein
MVTCADAVSFGRTVAAIGRMGVVLALLGCDSSAPLVSSDPTPALYFVVSDGPGEEGPADVFGLVATSALVRDARYLPIVSAAARRVADERALALDVLAKNGPLVEFTLGMDPRFRMDDGNLRWRQVGDGGRLGVQDVAAGDSIEIVVETEVARVHGAFRMPARQLPIVRVESGRRMVYWNRDSATSFWTVQVGLGGALVRDTVLDVDATISPFFLEGADSVSITAYDRNSALFFGLPARDAAGVLGGLGVVGAVVRGAPVPLPPKP